MSSSTGFQSTTGKETQGRKKKKMVSKGLLFIGIVLLLLIAAWFGLSMYEKSLNSQKDAISSEVVRVKGEINSLITKEEADFAVRAYTLEDELYRGYDSNDILQEIENIMVLKNSDNSGDRVVLKSFQYNAGADTKKTFNDGNATITSAGSVTITADADTFDAMAQQIDAFKKSSYFNNVKVGTTDRDDFNRIIFTLSMDVNAYENSPYEDGDVVTTGENSSQTPETMAESETNNTDTSNASNEDITPVEQPTPEE